MFPYEIVRPRQYYPDFGLGVHHFRRRSRSRVNPLAWLRLAKDRGPRPDCYSSETKVHQPFSARFLDGQIGFVS